MLYTATSLEDNCVLTTITNDNVTKNKKYQSAVMQHKNLMYNLLRKNTPRIVSNGLDFVLALRISSASKLSKMLCMNNILYSSNIMPHAYIQLTNVKLMFFSIFTNLGQIMPKFAAIITSEFVRNNNNKRPKWFGEGCIVTTYYVSTRQ